MPKHNACVVKFFAGIIVFEFVRHMYIRNKIFCNSYYLIFFYLLLMAGNLESSYQQKALVSAGAVGGHHSFQSVVIPMQVFQESSLIEFKMPQCCVVPFCSTRSSGHCFPKDEQLRQKWIESIRRYKFKPTKYSRICNKHFIRSDYEMPLDSILQIRKSV